MKPILLGDKWGNWTVVAKMPKDSLFLCECDCGVIKEISNSNLRKMSDSCFQCRKKKCDINIGDTFGKYTVTKLPFTKGNGHKYVCKCECGKEIKLLEHSLRYGKHKSCKSCNRKYDPSHPLSKTTLYELWESVMSRCYNKKQSSYKYYGGKGIGVCERWRTAENFIEDMHPRPSKTCLTRINSDQDFSPDNCIWATYEEVGKLTRGRHLQEKNKQFFDQANEELERLNCDPDAWNDYIKEREEWETLK